MKIIENSIKDISDHFEVFSQFLKGTNYGVTLEGFIFSFTGERNFILPSTAYFNKYKKEEFRGKTIEMSFDESQACINKYLRIGGAGVLVEGSAFYNTTDSEWEKRKKIFWMLVNELIECSSLRVFRFDPSQGPFRASGMGDFCYVFLTEGRGLILHGGTED